MIRKVIATMSLGVGLAVCGLAEASLITYSADFDTRINFSEEVAGNLNIPPRTAFDLIELPRFDGALGSLQGVEISFVSNYRFNLAGLAEDNVGEVDFVLYPPFVVNGRNDAGLDLMALASLELRLFDPSSSSRTLTLSPLQADCSVSVSEDQAVDCEILSVFRNGTYSELLPIGLIDPSQFIGADPINLYSFASLSVSGLCDFNDSGDFCEAFSSLLWFGTVNVNYTYLTDGENGNTGDGGTGGGTTSVPEPGTLSLLGLGLLGMAGARRRREV